MKVLVTGCRGQLSTAIQERAAKTGDLDIEVAGRPKVDLEVSSSVADAIRTARPDVVINAAAYTNVDQAEDEPERAFRINAGAAAEAAGAAQQLGAPIIQISTDYVFDGTAAGAYREEAPTNPLGVYGRSKLLGEEQVRAANKRHLIFRTAWVYSPFGRNFVKTMLRIATERDEVRVVADQFGSPTSALELADVLFNVVRQWRDLGMAVEGKTYHVVGQGTCSWADFAEEVFRVSGTLGGPAAAVHRIATSEFPTKAKRPSNSVLDTGKFAREFDYPLRHWRHSLAVVVERLLQLESSSARENRAP